MGFELGFELGLGVGSVWCVIFSKLTIALQRIKMPKKIDIQTVFLYFVFSSFIASLYHFLVLFAHFIDLYQES